jgi:hydrogenase expression/formation protein HypD
MDLFRDFRNPHMARKISEEIKSIAGSKPMAMMEVCGGQTHTIYKYRLREFLPPSVRLVSGPGCPVCVTPVNYIDKAISLAVDHGVSVFTFSDLIRVPGTTLSLEQARANGADIQTVYSPLSALDFAKQHPEKQVVFLGIGFETTLPPALLTIRHAHTENVGNYSVLLSAKRVPPVLETLLASGQHALNGFITPGHVTAIIGTAAYDSLCSRFHVPMVTGGFEPLDLLLAIRRLVQLISENRYDNENEYRRVPRKNGNAKAIELIDTLCEPIDEELRGLGVIPGAGYGLRDSYAAFDADKRFAIKVDSREPKGCICGSILAGLSTPGDCPLFRKVCSPATPVGACMVSNEGTCNAAFLYGE